MKKISSQLLLVVFLAAGLATAQTPTGTVSGIVTDSSGKPIADAYVRLTNRGNGLTRTLTTSAEGNYSAAALSPGEYQVTSQAEGFRVAEASVVVETGTTTTVNLTLTVGEITESVSVDTTAPLIQYESHQVGGLVNRRQLENLPLNGRNFLEEAKLEPGVQPPTRSSSNRMFVPALGQPGGNSGRGTRVTVDGGSIMTVGNGGSAMGFSQEVVQEFQVTTVNFDLTTGLTNGAAINVTTRSGTNELHGTGFYFFRDHNLAAYPALNRSAENPDPFFQRRQFGVALSGPIRRDRFFFFGTYERNEQRGVVATTLPEFAHLNRVTPSPFFNDQLSVRMDGHLSNAHTAFVRYSHDGIQARGPRAIAPNGYPSSWVRQPSWADQSIFGLTSLFGAALVNDLRFSFFYVNSSVLPVTEKECPGCLGVGAPSITIPSIGLTLGDAPIQLTNARRFHLNDYATWQWTKHRLRFGVDWEYNRGGNSAIADEPVTLTLYSPQQSLSIAGIQVPTAFNTIDDILQLPLQSAKVGIGNPRVPQANGSLVRSWNTLRLFLQDTWRPNSQLTINYGLGWSIDRNLNYDLTKPQLLAPILGADGLGPTRKLWKNFSPVLGTAWSPWSNGKTVIRAAAGFYHDFLFPSYLETERALLGPPGLGRQTFTGDGLLNCLPNIPGVPAGTPLKFPKPTRFTGANLMACLPAIRAELIRTLANADRSIQTIQLTKQASGLSPADVPSWSALHSNLGVQREIARDFVINADFVFRHFDHVGLGLLDLNHFDSVRGPTIPKCTDDAQRIDPYAQCSNGPINVQTNAGRVNYKGLLVRAEKRFRQGFQFLGSWAYSSNAGTDTPGGDLKLPPGFNLDDWLTNRGPLSSDTTNIVNLAGVVHLPWDFRVGLNFSYARTPSFSAFVGRTDFNGDGTTDDLLPGTTLMPSIAAWAVPTWRISSHNSIKNMRARSMHRAHQSQN